MTAVEGTAQYRSPAAERMARSRQRKKDGLVWLEIELRVTEVDALIRRGFLAPADCDDKIAIADAFHAWLDQAGLEGEA